MGNYIPTSESSVKGTSKVLKHSFSHSFQVVKKKKWGLELDGEEDIFETLARNKRSMQIYSEPRVKNELRHEYFEKLSESGRKENQIRGSSKRSSFRSNNPANGEFTEDFENSVRPNLKFVERSFENENFQNFPEKTESLEDQYLCENSHLGRKNDFECQETCPESMISQNSQNTYSTLKKIEIDLQIPLKGMGKNCESSTDMPRVSLIGGPRCKNTQSSKNLNRNANLKSMNEYELNFVKNGEDLRRSYIAKLIYKKVWEPSKKEKDHNSLIIFDWDDTLLCTSFLTPNGIFNEDMELKEKEKEKVARLELITFKILTAAIERGDTYIITNAAPGWVEYSCERFYPSVKELLTKVKIISARGDYEALYPGDSRMWKIHAFLNMQKTFDNNLVTNIICLGDSFIEMEAAHVLASKFSQAFIKTVKFRECPKPEELNKQLTLVAEQFPVIYSTVKNLTIRVEKKAKKGSM